MASGFQTSDGVDLDSRYLGINAKAKSAATADTAAKANTVTSLGSGRRVYMTGDVVYATVNAGATYNVVADSFLMTSGANGLIINGKTKDKWTGSLISDVGLSFVKKGDQLSVKSGHESAWAHLLPISVQ